MASGNTAFRAESGLYVVGGSTLEGALQVTANLTVNGSWSLANVGTSNLIPTNNSYSVGNSTNRWAVSALSLDVSGDAVVHGNLTVNTSLSTGNLYPIANNTELGNTSLMWSVTANGVSAKTLGVSGAANVGDTLAVTNATTLSNTLSVAGHANLKSTSYHSGNTTLAGSSLAVTAAAGMDVAVSNTLTFDTDLMIIDAVNNLIGIKTAPVSAGVLAVNGNIAVVSNNSGLKFFTAGGGNTTSNASLTYSSNATDAYLLLNIADFSNTTVANGGLKVTSSNSTTTNTVMSLNKLQFQYMSGNVAHAGNFGIYNVSGTRLGP
jgi:hypothetical protein